MPLMQSLLNLRASKSGGTHPGEWGGIFSKLFGKDDAISGVDVTEWTVQNLSTVYACSRAISEDVAKLPLHLFRRLAKGGRERAINDPSYQLLLKNPNPEMTAFSFRETLQHHALMWGRGCAEIERKKNGEPLYLWPLKPTRTEIKRDPVTGEIVYGYTKERGGKVWLQANDVFHIHGLGFDGITGYSVVRMAQQSFGAALAADKFAAAFWGNHAMPAGVLTHPMKLSPEAAKRLRKSFKENYSGPTKAGEVALLEEGMTLQPMTIAPQDAQFLETRQFSVAEICRWFRFPPHMAQDLSRATFSNIEHQALEYINTTLLAWLVRWEQEAARKLIGGDPDLYFEHLVDSMLRGDIKTRFEAYKNGILTGFMMLDEARERENLPPLPDGQGQLVMVPVNMTTPELLREGPMASPDTKGPFDDDPKSGKDDPAAAPNEDPPAAKPKKAKKEKKSVREIVSAAMPLLTEITRTLRYVEADKLRRAAKRNELGAFAPKFFTDHVEHVRTAYRASVDHIVLSCRSACGTIGSPLLITNALAQIHVDRSRSAIRMPEPGGTWVVPKPEELDAMLDGWSGERSDEFSAEMADALVSMINPFSEVP